MCLVQLMILISVLSKQIRCETKVDSGGAFICLLEHHVHQLVVVYARLVGAMCLFHGRLLHAN